MVRRIIGIVLILLGAASIVVGYLSATQWRTSDIVTATSPQAEVPFVVVEPGVPGVVDSQVEVSITAADPAQTVTLITGRDVDVDGWLADAAHQRLVDVVDWETMVTEDVDGVTADLPSPVGNDMWLETEEAEGEISFDYEVPTTGRQTFLIVRDGAEGPAPTVSFTWQREVATPYLIPLVAAGAAAVVLGLVLVVWSIVARRRSRKSAKELDGTATATSTATATDGDGGAAAESAPDTDADTAVLGAVPTDPAPDAGVGGAIATPGEPSDPPTAETAVLTRRQLRKLAESGAAGATVPGPYEGLRERLAEVDVERIASDIGPAAENAPAPDDPEAYPSWLRATGEASPAADEPPPAEEASTWRRRWGVADGTATEPAEVEPVETDPAETETSRTEKEDDR